MTKTERQKIGIRKWIDSGGHASWSWCTGMGKTYGACMLIKALYSRNKNLSVLIGVPTEFLKNQWYENLKEQNIDNICKVEIFNTIVNNTYNVDLLILDELHCVAAPKNIQIFKVVKYRYLLGLTATFERLDNRHELLLKYTSICDIITVDEAIKNNWLSNYKNYKVLIDVDLTKYNEWNSKFCSLFSIFNNNFILAKSCLKNNNVLNKYSKITNYSTKQLKTYALMWMQMLKKRKAFVMSHPKKFEIVDKILQSRLDKKIIIFSATIKDSKYFEKYNAYFVNSKQTKKINKEIISNFNSLTSGILSTSKAADCGVDIKGLNTGIILSGDSSKIRSTQRIGRIIRFEKNKISEMFTLVIRNTVDEIWFNNSNSNQNYITINENQLEQILQNKDISIRPKLGLVDIENRY